MGYAGNYNSTERIHLDVGLPPEHYGILKDKFSKYFKRPQSIHFSYNDKPMTIMMGSVYVYPQAFAAIAPLKAQLNHHLQVFLVDIGDTLPTCCCCATENQICSFAGAWKWALLP